MRQNTQTESRNINDRKLRNILSSKTSASTAAGGSRSIRSASRNVSLYLFVVCRPLFPSLSSAVATDFANYKLKTLNFALSRISPNEWQSKERHQDRTQCRRHTHTSSTHTQHMYLCVYISN